MKLIIARADELDVDLIFGCPGYVVWKGKLKEDGGDGLEGEEMKTLDPITELDLDSKNLMYLIEHGLLDAETLEALFNEGDHVSLKYIFKKYRITHIVFKGTIFRYQNGLPCCLYLFRDPHSELWSRGCRYL